MEKAVTYGNQNGGTGRLLTSSEAETLKSSMNEAFSPSESVLNEIHTEYIDQYLYY